MQKICTNCKEIGRESGNVPLLVLSIIIILLGLTLIINIDLLDIFSLIGSIVLVLFGIYGIFQYYNHPNKCPNCESKNTMIPFDTPKAQEIIKENDLSVPE